MFICIAGKNQCAIDGINILLKSKIKKDKILALPINSDNGKDIWQPSFKKYVKNKKIKIINLNYLYKIKNLIFLSFEYDKIIDVKKFKSKKLFNFHFSLLPKYRGCHTNFMQIFNGERFSGVTLHKIDKGIDTGPILDQLKFRIKINDTAYDNYLTLMKTSIKVFNKNFRNILDNKYMLRKQNLSKGSYYNKTSINYKLMNKISMDTHSLRIHNKIRSFIFPAYQYPIVNGLKVLKSIYKNKKIYLTTSYNYK